ncbi:hypothetical protein SLEP1_g44164 [Rubroshorea leprosula]|uniref:PGG domain-containing protein n=1 Tax=Rubroshorea leprosula TaxID=152421 RepID=A0AAV5LGB5_9ROSI|nr:hypothetical protein SLEP1_g44164 [Rubroshorea leprosula]
MKHIYEQKLIHRRAVEIVHRISDELSTLNARELIKSGAIPAFFQAVQHGITEIVNIWELGTLVPECKEFVNRNGETPQQVFSRDHKQLAKEGEEWMKQTAQSYTFVGALIITIMFAAGFTIPGGNNQDTGFPIFLRKRLFMVFILSDAISLFSACTSVSMFLGILTSRYAEEDFLKSLPTKLIIGICTLLISITAMMVAFCAAVSIMLQGRWWVIILLVLFASIPIEAAANWRTKIDAALHALQNSCTYGFCSDEKGQISQRCSE